MKAPFTTSYNQQDDILYIRGNEVEMAVDTKEVFPGVFLHFGKDRRLVAIVLFDVTKIAKRRCAVCGGILGEQCWGGTWTNDVADWLDGKIAPSSIRESCPLCLNGEPTYMYGQEVHDAILERRRAWNEERLNR